MNNKLKGGNPLFVGKFCSEISTLPGHTREVTSVVFHPNRNLLATGSEDKTAKIYRFNDDGSNLRHIDSTFTSKKHFTGHSGSVTSVAFHPNRNLLATGSRDNTAKIWRFKDDGSDLTWCGNVGKIKKHTNGVLSVAFHPNGNLLATDSNDNNYAKLFSFNDDGSNPILKGITYGHKNIITSIAFNSRGNLLATGSWDDTAKLYRFDQDSSNPVCTGAANGHTSSVYSVAFHPSLNLLATGSDDKTSKLWSFHPDGSNLVCISTLVGHSRWVNSVAFHPDGNFLATGSSDKTAKLWSFNPDGSNPICIETLTGHTDWVRSVAFHPNGNLLATGSDDTTAKLWDCSKLSTKYRRRLALTHGILASSLIDELTENLQLRGTWSKYRMRSILHQSIGNVLGINTPASRANTNTIKYTKFSEFPSREQGPDTSTGLPPSPVIDTPLQPVVDAAEVTGFCAVDDMSCISLFESIPWLELNSIPGGCDEASELLEKLVRLKGLLESSSSPEIDSKLRLTTLWIKKLRNKIDQCKP